MSAEGGAQGACGDGHRLGTELPAQHLYLAVYGKAEPEVRYPNRTSRTVYVSYFWETGPDPSLVDCHGAQECASATPAVPPPLPEITFAEAQLHLAVVEAQLCAYARQTRSPPALAAVQPTRAAQRQPNPEPR